MMNVGKTMDHTNFAFLTVFSPLLGFFISAILSLLILNRGQQKQADLIAQLSSCALMLIASIASFILFKDLPLDQKALTVEILPWINVGDFKVSWGFKLDSLSVLMMSMVTFVSFLIHVYSVGYMSHDKSIPRFMGYLSLFTFMMLMLVTAPNLVQLFFGWEGVGLASYLLIGFWYERPSANAASIKAFLVNRVGDVGFALGIAAIFMVYQTVEFDPLFAKMLANYPNIARPTLEFLGGQWDALTLIGVLLIIGAMGKSAQLGLHTWLPDAMEGPTPVSALIHAATMVTAGVFLMCRMSHLYMMIPIAQDMLIVIGALTAFFAATVAITQTDIKRVIAYSTCSQLGYMMFAAGCMAYDAAMYHLIAHAFFKALLFLGAGSVIHAMSDEQDMTKMGGIYRLIPFTYIFMWIGNIQLAAIPLFSLHQSKDIIIESAFLQGTNFGQFAFYIGVIVAFLTALYSWRLLLLTFHGPAQADDKVMAHVHESPLSMLIPLGVLSVGAILSSHFGYHWLVGEYSTYFWNGSIPQPHHGQHVPTWVIWAPVLFALLGIALAYVLYGGKRTLPQRLANSFKFLFNFSYQKWYFDELYNYLFVNRAFSFGKILWQWGDKGIIDRFGPDGLTKASLSGGKVTSKLETGYVYHYAFAMILGIILMIGLYLQHNGGTLHAG